MQVISALRLSNSYFHSDVSYVRGKRRQASRELICRDDRGGSFLYSCEEELTDAKKIKKNGKGYGNEKQNKQKGKKEYSSENQLR